MHEGFILLLKSLNVPLLADAEMRRFSNYTSDGNTGKIVSASMGRSALLRINAWHSQNFSTTRTHTKQRMLVVAGANLTGTRYALLRKACAALRGRISAEAAAAS
jgi:hypothetical protein